MPRQVRKSKDINCKDIVKGIFKKATDKDAEVLLWECTSFPFGSPDIKFSAAQWYAKQLRKLHKKSGGNVRKAFAINMAEISKAMANMQD